jgi:anti-sigma B factor antagonist
MVRLPVDASAAAVDDPAVTPLLDDRGDAAVGNGTTMSGLPTFESSSLRLAVQAAGCEVLVAATGEFDLAGSPVVEAMFAEVVTTSCRRVVIDVSGVTFVDAAGLRALRGPASCAGRLEVCLRAPSRPVRRVLELIDMVEHDGPSASPRRDDRQLCFATESALREGD